SGADDESRAAGPADARGRLVQQLVVELAPDCLDRARAWFWPHRNPRTCRPTADEPLGSRPVPGLARPGRCVDGVAADRASRPRRRRLGPCLYRARRVIWSKSRDAVFAQRDDELRA